jgi:hypothetical protein
MLPNFQADSVGLRAAHNVRKGLNVSPAPTLAKLAKL